ncbi:alkaline phosphatase D family protein [Lysinibacillus sp. BW-2-10]|uniref:alkaline phosphatase D family protein n=1 Tax=Lysinibacillus sp. BW-2-10 TaxID=2590030 RepID=UPI00117EE8F1|nr:alkaline phosphatase D family protein [Lysinibacillus sp. BW-2-10]TSI05085.1 hypothetical protein FJQ64_12260 [Lysinibacillus sp. BW-2-10]
MKSFKFPALLAGPILRRVEPTKAYVWVATSKAYSIGAQIYEITTKHTKDYYSKLRAATETTTVQFGENLFIHLIKITPKNGLFPTNQLIGYNLYFTIDNESFDLGDLDLLSEDNPNNILYDSLNYPTFFIADNHNSNNFLYGSCRNLHGEGEDTLANGDRELAEKSRDLTQRPQALFTMGDQIYADNVADPLFRPIHEISSALIGVNEKLHTIDKRLAKKPYNTSLYKTNGRTAIMKQFAEFSSRKAANHMMEFGEFAALYLFYWSPVLWEVVKDYALFESFQEALDNDHIYIESQSDKLKKLETKQLEKRYTEHEKALANCHQTAYKIRRLLANIPTYMIFDDHDITDDWNINAEWKATVQKSPIGKHVVTNGLTAYWAFQGWGNAPESFEEEFISQLQHYFHSLQNEQIDYRSWMDLLWEHRPWHFVAPTNPKAVFLDTRTMREYEDKPHTTKIEQLSPETYPPQLVNDEEFEALAKQLEESEWEKGTPLIVISATPVIGFEIIEELVSTFTPSLKMLGVEVQTVFDVEAWKYNGKGLTRILTQLANWNPSQCIILSGDVHYGFSVNSTVTFVDGKELTIKQITSSPQKNMSFHRLGPLMKIVTAINSRLKENQLNYRYCDPSYQIHTNDTPDEKFIWKEQFSYDQLTRLAIIETDNHLGLLTVKDNEITNKFLK